MSESSPFSLHGHRALITGSSRGIGRALALAFAKHGADVVIHGWNDRPAAEEVAREIAAIGRRTGIIQTDLASDSGAADTYRETMTALGQAPDILVCNASIQIPQAWLEVTRQEFDEQVAVNWRSTLELCQQAVPAMQAAHWGRILTLGSVQEARPHPQMIVYAGTKSAQASLASNLARQLSRDGITANNLSPGVILTDRSRSRLEDPAYAEKLRQSIPVGFFGEATDCVGAALLLCSDAGRYITGQTLFVDGGMSLP